MTSTNPPTRRTGAVVAGIAAIPFVSVTLVALMADATSTTDAPASIGGLGALGAGLIMGLLVLRLIGAVRSGLTMVRVVIERMVDQIISDLVVAGRSLRGPINHHLPAPARVPTRVGRRGPPTRTN